MQAIYHSTIEELDIQFLNMLKKQFLGAKVDIVILEKDEAIDNYPTISKEEAKKRVTQAVQEVKSDRAILVTKEEYEKDMNVFMKSL